MWVSDTSDSDRRVGFCGEMGKNRREELSILGPKEEFLERIICWKVNEGKGKGKENFVKKEKKKSEWEEGYEREWIKKERERETERERERERMKERKSYRVHKNVKFQDR